MLNADQVIGHQTFISCEAAHYPSAYIAMLIGYSVKLVAILALCFYMYRANKARDAAGQADERAAVELGMHDVAELDILGFVTHLVLQSNPVLYIIVALQNNYASIADGEGNSTRIS
ncbi:hypothetical protein DL767_003329 [Monosporascus sp. MG133]|nr:hypothetical protein DL767_003329 [Monosporascus sp. MG133]